MMEIWHQVKGVRLKRFFACDGDMESSEGCMFEGLFLPVMEIWHQVKGGRLKGFFAYNVARNHLTLQSCPLPRLFHSN